MSHDLVVRRRVTRWLLAPPVACILLLSQAPTAASETAPPKFGPPKHYYLSLGDSWGFGLQLEKFFAELEAGTYSPDSFNTGYTDVFAELMRRIRPDLKVVNYSCPGSGGDTTRFLTDGCAFTDFGLDLHDNFTGSQMDAAVSFLRDHRGQVGPITLSAGGDDIAQAVYSCNADPDCVANSGLADRLVSELGEILSRLRAAAPDAEIILLLPFNGVSIDFPDSNDLWGTYVELMRSIAAAHRVRVVDAFSAITLSGRECELTFLCIGDGHATDEGYSVLGHLFFNVAGYARLRR
jgi:GDSL-like Lipase/Acylhydrolase family